MTLPLFLVAAVCAVNAPRARTVLPPDDRVRLAGLGAALTLVVLAVLALVGEPLLDGASISAPTARIACGLLLVAVGILAFGSPGPDPEPSLPGRRAALVPVAFPTLLTPGLGVLAVVGAVDHDVPTAVGLLALALATVPLVAALPVSTQLSPRTGRPVSDRVLDGVARLLAAVLVVAGLAVLFDGVFDI
jgi:small neutral amino acid transporter SnatA (MarC family)